MIDHDVMIFRLPSPGLTQARRFGMSAKMHVRRVGPDEELFPLLICARDETLCGPDKFVVDRLHAFLGQRPGVLDLLPALSIRPAVKHATGTKVLPEVWELRFGRVISQFRLLLCVQMVEVAEELVEPVHRRQVLVPVAEVVLPELAGSVSQRLQKLGYRRILSAHALLSARQPNLTES